MKHNKEILKYCPNFYKIVNLDYNQDDVITDKLIRVYEDFVYKINPNDIDDLETLKTFDTVINKYLEDNCFRKEMKEQLLTVKIKKTKDILRTIVNSIINIFENYVTYATRKVTISRWI